jgi:hypothetical protein
MLQHNSPHDRESPLNFELIGYDELGRLPIIGRSSDRESILEVPERPAHGLEAESRPQRQREFLANDFWMAGF